MRWKRDLEVTDEQLGGQEEALLHTAEQEAGDFTCFLISWSNLRQFTCQPP